MSTPEDEVDYDALYAAAATRFLPTDRSGDSSILGAHTVNWRTLEADSASAEWVALRAWVEWVTVRYNISQSVVPTCWYKHGALVEELSALHTAHSASFDPADTGYGPIGWHERLALTHARLARAYGGGCNNGHQEVRARSWQGTVDESDWTAWTTEVHAHEGP